MKNSIAAVSILLASAAAWVRPAPQLDRRDVIEFLSHVEMVDLPIDGQGHTVRAVRISGLNVQIVNGLDATASNNGLGNLLVGYGEHPETSAVLRTGSHNIACGIGAQYSSYGGLVAGKDNYIAAPWCSITGGEHNYASAWASAVCGGYYNATGGGTSTVSGGFMRNAPNQDDWAAGSLYEDL